jgi:hypothetical protein
MSETELLELGAALARPGDVLRPGTIVPFRDYLRVVLADHGAEVHALFGDGAHLVSVDGQVVDGPDATMPVTAASRVVLYRRQGPMLDVLDRGVVRRICLN